MRPAAAAALLSVAAAAAAQPCGVSRCTVAGCCANNSAAGLARGHDLTGKTLVLTGGDSGIGYHTALALAATNVSIVIGSYDAGGRGREAAANITRDTGNAKVTVHPLDLSSLASVRGFAAAALADSPTVDLLLCDAGTSGPRQLTADGFEHTIEVNYLGHFLLAELLLPALRRSGAGRVVSVSSLAACSACGGAGLPDNCTDVDALRGVVRMGDGGAPTYGVSKFLQVYHARELSMREAARGSAVRAYTARPGLVDTEGAHAGMLPIWPQLCANPAVADYSPCPMPGSAGADTPTRLLVAPLEESDAGGFFFMCRVVEPPAWEPAGGQAAAQRELYDLSLTWVGAV